LPYNLILERGVGITRETKPGKVLVKIFAEGQHLKIPAEHFRMQQSLQGAFFRSVKVRVWKKFRNNSSEKMMLIGKTDWHCPGRYCCFGQAGPLDMRGNIGQPDLLERRRKLFCFARTWTEPWLRWSE
jgi:hypothetical protein